MLMVSLCVALVPSVGLADGEMPLGGVTGGGRDGRDGLLLLGPGAAGGGRDGGALGLGEGLLTGWLMGWKLLDEVGVFRAGGWGGA